MTEFERGQWDMFTLIASVCYGKECYFLQDDGKTVYSRRSGKYMSISEAYDEFIDYLGEY